MTDKVLDWKLDFINPTFARHYNIQFKKFLLLQTKLALAAIGVGVIFLPIIEVIVHKTSVLDFKIWNPVYFIIIWCIVWFPVFVWRKTRPRLVLFSSITFSGLSYIATISNLAEPDNYLYDDQGFHVSLMVLIIPLVLNLRNVYAMGLMIGAEILQVIAILVLKHDEPWHFQIGYIIPNFASFALAFYCGYYMEHRMKFDFLRRKLMDYESQKLGWIVARDASLLRNIFPKNLSDELELQMSNRPARPPTLNSAVAKHGHGANPLTKHGNNSNPTIANGVPNGVPHSRSTNGSNKSLTTTMLMRAISAQSVPRHQQQEKEVVALDKNSRPESITIRVESKHHEEPSQILPPTTSEVTNITPRVKELKIPLTHRELPPTPPSRDRFTSLSITIPSQVETATGDSPPSSPIFSIPPVINTPLVSPRSELDLPELVHSARYLTSAGTPLRTGHGPELHTFLSGAQHSDGSLIALSHSYQNVVVIFADIVGFTSLSSCISPQDLVQLLNKLFSMFDDIIDKHGLEKIRTVGDAYLCVANMSRPLETPEESAVIVAQKMISSVTNIKDKKLCLRVGIASGPCIAGVTGIMKWNYDIFGKPYADATFMETCAGPNCISVTKAVYQPCSNNKRFNFEQLNVTRDGETVERWLIDMENDTKGGFGEPLIVQFRDDPLGLRDRNDGLAVLAQPDFVQKGLDINERQILDKDSDSASEISLADFNFDQKFNFTKDELNEEERRVKKSRANFFSLKFTSPSFETEYMRSSAEKAYRYTSNVVKVFMIITIFFLISELCLADPGPSSLPAGVWVTFALILVDLGGYLLFHHFLDTHPSSHHVAAGAIFLFDFGFLMLSYFHSSNLHYNWILFVMFYTSCFARVQGLSIIIMQLVIALISIVFTFAHASSDLDAPVRHVTSLLLIVALTVSTQYFMVKSFRMEFLAHKRVKYDTFHQKIAQYRAKLLLRNILPEEIIPRLQPAQDGTQKGVVNVVDVFEEATMMFVNLTNLEELTDDLDPASTFQVYNEVYTLFDEATRACGLEKIKTINTVYMVASGLPKKIENHAEMALKLAKEFYHITSHYTFPLIKKKLKVRIGIASGPVVAGIIGKKKYSYDCWSDTTNTASRMESNGWNSYAQITPATYALIHDKFEFQKREQIAIKGKGSMDTYVLKLSSPHKQNHT